MNYCPQCGGSLRPTLREDESSPGDVERYPLACDGCGILIAADWGHTFQPHRCRDCGQPVRRSPALGWITNQPSHYAGESCPESSDGHHHPTAEEML